MKLFDCWPFWKEQDIYNTGPPSCLELLHVLWRPQAPPSPVAHCVHLVLDSYLGDLPSPKALESAASGLKSKRICDY